MRNFGSLGFTLGYYPTSPRTWLQGRCHASKRHIVRVFIDATGARFDLYQCTPGLWVGGDVYGQDYFWCVDFVGTSCTQANGIFSSHFDVSTNWGNPSSFIAQVLTQLEETRMVEKKKKMRCCIVYIYIWTAASIIRRVTWLKKKKKTEGNIMIPRLETGSSSGSYASSLALESTFVYAVWSTQTPTGRRQVPSVDMKQNAAQCWAVSGFTNSRSVRKYALYTRLVQKIERSTGTTSDHFPAWKQGRSAQVP